jgi:hypothetical protein
MTHPNRRRRNTVEPGRRPQPPGSSPSRARIPCQPTLDRCAASAERSAFATAWRPGGEPPTTRSSGSRVRGGSCGLCSSAGSPRPVVTSCTSTALRSALIQPPPGRSSSPVRSCSSRWWLSEPDVSAWVARSRLGHLAAMTSARHRHWIGATISCSGLRRNHDELPKTAVKVSGARVVTRPSTTRGAGDDPKGSIERPGP